MSKALTISFPAPLWKEIEAIQAERSLEEVDAASAIRELLAEAIIARKAKK
jgi:hypothetical protein